MRVRDLLAPGGRFAFDLVAPRYDFLAEAVGGLPAAARRRRPPGARATASRASCAATPTPTTAASQTLRSTNRYEIYHEDGRVEHRIADLDWHIYFPEELELLLEPAPG